MKNILIGSSWILAILASLTWLSIAGVYLVKFNGGISTTNKEWLLAHPITFISYAFYTLSHDMGQYLISTYGGKLLWGGIVQYTIFPLLLCFLSIGITIGDEKLKNRFNTFQKIIMILVMSAIVGLILMSEFLTWTVPGTPQINGVQGRYFIPILPILLLLLGNIKFKNEYSETDTLKIIGTTGLLMLFYIIGSIYIL